MCRTGLPGHSHSEYAILLAIVLVVSLAALAGLGGSVSTLLSGKVGGALGTDGNGGDAGSVMGILKPVKAATPKIDPGTGLPIVPFSDIGGASTNATSIPGQHMDEVGTVLLASTMKQLAETEEDPTRAALYKMAAEKMYYSGAAQGAAKGVPDLKIPTVTIPGQPGKSGFLGIFGRKKAKPPRDINYNRADAVSDVTRFQAEIDAIMQSVPADLNDPAYVTAMALVNDAKSIGQKFVSDPANAGVPPTGRRVDDASGLPDVEQVKSRADTVLANNKVDDVEVEVTFTDARMTERLAERKRKHMKEAASQTNSTTSVTTL